VFIRDPLSVLFSRAQFGKKVAVLDGLA